MPLEGIRIIDWSMFQQGPVAATMLGDLGADVIKIEEPISGDLGRYLYHTYGADTRLKDDRSCAFEVNNRNKKSITVNLKKEKGKEIIYRLVEKSDVFVQNYRKGVPERLGLDYNTLVQHNPRLIYATASGYGPKGPDSETRSLDYLALARSGIMYAAGDSTMPPLPIRGSIADQMGATVLAYGVLAALLARERLGVGQEVNVSHLASMIHLQAIAVTVKLLTGQEFDRRTQTSRIDPMYNHYQCKDGKWIAFTGGQGERFWPPFCRALGLGKLEKDLRFENFDKRRENCEDLISILNKVIATKTLDEWLKILREAGDLMFAPVNTISDLVNDPQVLQNEYIVDFDHPSLGRIKIVGMPVELSKTPGAVRTPAPNLGQHTEEVLLELCGYTWEEIAQLRAEEVV